MVFSSSASWRKEGKGEDKEEEEYGNVDALVIAVVDEVPDDFTLCEKGDEYVP